MFQINKAYCFHLTISVLLLEASYIEGLEYTTNISNTHHVESRSLVYPSELINEHDIIVITGSTISTR
jgi:hypothetical protein